VLFALCSTGPKFTVSALPDTSSATDMTNHSGQIVDPVDPSMSSVVAFDISKGQYTDDVQEFIADLQGAGFTVATVDISEGIPTNIKKIIVLGARGGGYLLSQYTAAEGTVLANWVSGGGELMILGDWNGFAYYTPELILPFGVTPLYNQVTDPTDYDTYNYWVIYQSDNFAAHPILAGVTATEHMSGESFEASSGAIITADSDASPSGAIVAVAKGWGSGRVAIFGDYDWVCTFNGGYGKVNNAKVAMQTIYWLNGISPPGLPEFELAIPCMTAILTALYLGISKRLKK
jgi:hypothetical protein